MLLLKANTAVDVLIGPFLDDTDGKTTEEGLTISQADVLLTRFQTLHIRPGTVFGWKTGARLLQIVHAREETLSWKDRFLLEPVLGQLFPGVLAVRCTGFRDRQETLRQKHLPETSVDAADPAAD